VDGPPESLLVVPVKHPRSTAIYGLVLRGKRSPDFFTEKDEMVLSKIAAQIVLALTSSERFERMAQDLDRSRASEKRNQALLQVAECLSGQLQIDALMPDIMERGCALVDADRCSLFLVDESRGKLVTSFHGGLANAIEIPMNAGVVGYSATTGRVTNIPNAYEDPRFNRETDRATGYRTETLLCVPIFDQNGGIRGVTEMINKRRGTFTTEDEDIIKAFNIFAGISVENARLYHASIDLSMQLKGILEISQSITQSKTTKRVIADLLKNSRKVIGAASSTVHLWDHVNRKLEVFAVDEDACLKAEAEHAPASTAQARRSAIRKILRDGKAPELQSEDSGNLDYVQRAIAARESNIMNHPTNHKQSLIVAPIVGSNRQVLGALMMQWKKRGSRTFTVEDMKLLEGFAVFVGISIEKSQSDPGVSLSPVEIAIRQAMSESERMHGRCPIRLAMSEEERAAASSAGFSPLGLDDTQLAKIGFWIFDTLGIREEYAITNETLFAFLFRMKELHSHDVNTGWHHAIGIAQMLVYALRSGREMQLFTKLEKLAMIVSLLAHDVGLECLLSESSRNAKTFLRLTAADVSMKERFHATVLVNAVSDAQANLFGVLKQDDLDSLMGLVLDLMHSVDLAKHFDILDEIDAVEADKDWFQSGRGRILFMKLLVKGMVVSDLARPLEYASLFKDQIVEAFFDNADLSRCYGMMYTADEKKRENLDRDRSQVAMITYVVIPLFNRIAQIIPVLGLSVEQVRHNLRCFTCEVPSPSKGLRPSQSLGWLWNPV
jgi:GAF domain-containing protein